MGQGRLALSYLARLPSFLRELALVKGTNERTSSRLRNALHAGEWVNDYESLERCKLLWIAVSEDSLPAILSELAEVVDLGGRMIVLADTLRDSGFFSLLAQRGARVATVNLMPESSDRVFVTEGHSDVVKELRRILESDNRKLIELRPGAKPMFVSGIHLSAHMLLPFAGAAVESFRFAGLTRNEAALAMQAIASNALRAYVRGGDRALPREHAELMRKVLDESRETLRAMNPRMAELYDADPGMWLFYVGAQLFWRGSAQKDDAGARLKAARRGA